MRTTQLQKQNDRLYHEPGQEAEKPLKWQKALESLRLELANVNIRRSFTIERPETSLERRFFSSLLLNASEADGETGGGEGSAAALAKGDENAEAYSERLTWRMTATGRLSNRRLGLIRKDGSVSFGTREIEVTLTSIPDSQKQDSLGYLGYIDEETARYEDREEAYFYLELPVPESVLGELSTKALQGLLSHIEVDCYAEVFQSEVERNLAEPWMTQDYYLEEAFSVNESYLALLSVGTPPRLEDIPEDNDEPDESAADVEEGLRPSLSELLLQHTNALSMISSKLSQLHLLGWGVAGILGLLLVFR